MSRCIIERRSSCKKVLQEKTKGYRFYPQLLSFKATKNPSQPLILICMKYTKNQTGKVFTFKKGKIKKFAWIIRFLLIRAN
ncbi:MAG: hypothetical protein QXG86_01280 [Candidatus Woesearchaeota archaeon]